VKTVFLFINLISMALWMNRLESQPLAERYAGYGKLRIVPMRNALFPHAQREKGYTYRDEFYSSEQHYQDSSVALFIPREYNPGDSVNLVFHFHGWRNHIDSVFAQFKLIEQFCASGYPGILVVPQGPFDAPDSHGGKLEEINGFTRLVDEIVNDLYQEKFIRQPRIGDILLSGHSGAYRVIARILARGGMQDKIHSVFLFDALYADLEKYTYWLCRNDGRLFIIYTDDGGTDEETITLMDNLTGWQLPFFKYEEKTIDWRELENQRLVFIHTELTHNQVISERRQFYHFLQAIQTKVE